MNAESSDGNSTPVPEVIENSAIRLFEESRFNDAYRLLSSYLEQYGPAIDPIERAKLAHLLFETSRFASDPGYVRSAAIQWLEAAAEADETAWEPIADSATRAELDGVFAEPKDRLEFLELLSFAPPATGISESANALIEDFGHLHASDPALARDAERLLHALGQRDAAYWVEQSRRSVQLPAQPSRKRAGEEVRLTGLVVAIAGGHPALRRAINTDLSRAGAEEVREIPPSWEGSRQGREVVALVGGSDVAVLIGRHISHSTIDQVKRGAALSGVPVLTVVTASASGVRRAIEEHLKSTRLDKPSRST